MFVRRSEPVPVTEQGLAGLCPSLNRPVVEAEGLPVGPAQAVIALFRAPEKQDVELVVAVRSEDSGAVTVFEFHGELAAATHLALDAGLSFAEGMGFLFDEDLLIAGGDVGRRLAIERWCELTGDELPSSSALPELPLSEPVPPQGELLDDLLDGVEDDLDDLEGLDDVEELELEGEAALPESAVLSKFRLGSKPGRPAEPSAPEPPEAAPAEGAAQLGRIPILRRRRTDDPAGAPALLTRLLARF